MGLNIKLVDDINEDYAESLLNNEEVVLTFKVCDWTEVICYLEIGIFHKQIRIKNDDGELMLSNHSCVINPYDVEKILHKVNKFFSLYSSGGCYLSYRGVDYWEDKLMDGVRVIKQLAIETFGE